MFLKPIKNKTKQNMQIWCNFLYPIPGKHFKTSYDSKFKMILFYSPLWCIPLVYPLCESSSSSFKPAFLEMACKQKVGSKPEQLL